jgi:hypothetical protein
MEEYPVKVVLGIAFLVVIVVLWLVRKFFSKLFKFFLAGLIIVLIGVGSYVYRMMPQRDANIGKHAYLKRNGLYLGTVEGSGEDNQRAKVWIIRPPGGYPMRYLKSNVILKDRLEIEKEPEQKEK